MSGRGTQIDSLGRLRSHSYTISERPVILETCHLTVLYLHVISQYQARRLDKLGELMVNNRLFIDLELI